MPEIEPTLLERYQDPRIGRKLVWWNPRSSTQALSGICAEPHNNTFELLFERVSKDVSPARPDLWPQAMIDAGSAAVGLRAMKSRAATAPRHPSCHDDAPVRVRFAPRQAGHAAALDAKDLCLLLLRCSARFRLLGAALMLNERGVACGRLGAPS
jgi:hypothetical protein